MRLADLDLEIIYVNLSTRSDRRILTEEQLRLVGLSAKRQQGIQSRFVRDSRGFYNDRRYACSLAKRIAIRRAKLSRSRALLLLEDDVVFHPDLHERLSAIELPTDWQLFFLGCCHIEPPTIFSEGLVRGTRMIGNHAVIIRDSSYGAVIAALSGSGRGSVRQYGGSDLRLAELHAKLPMYCCYPNLAWQRDGFSDISRVSVRRYDVQGNQVVGLHAIDGLRGSTKRQSKE